MKTDTKKTPEAAQQLRPANTTGELRRIKLGLIVESKTNPRTDFPPAQMAELQTSIAARGIEEPLIVRELPGGKFELVAGARRTRCARALKLEEVPCIVKTMSDTEVQESQWTSFLREGLSDLEEAATFKRLIELQPGKTLEERIDALAPKLGKERSTILGRLLILKAIPAAQDALKAGKISQSHAQLIAGVPDHLQPRLLGEITKGDWNSNRETFSVRRTKEHIEEHYRVNLTKAPFKLDDAALCAKAGACLNCPKKQNPNICTDPVCFANKRELAFKAVEHAAVKNGQKVLSAKEWERVPYGKFVELDAECYETADNRNRIWRTLVKGGEVKPTLARNRNGELIEVMEKTAAVAAAKKNGVKFGSSAGQSNYEKKAREEAKKTKARRAVLTKVFAAAMLQISKHANRKHVDDVMFWKVMAAAWLSKIGEGQSNEESHFCKHRALEVKGESYNAGEKALQKNLESLTTLGDVRQFAIEACAIDGWLDFYHAEFGANFKAIAALYGVDLKALEKETAEALAEKKKPAGKAPEAAQQRRPTAKKGKKK